MKLFVAVVTFVIVPFVFADDVVWRLAPPFSLTPGGGGQAPKDRVNDSDEKKTQAQDAQQNTGNAPILLAEPNTGSSYKAGQRTQDNVEPKEASTMGDWFFQVLWTVGSIAGIVNIFFTARMTYLNHKRTKQRDVLEDRHWERTDRITQVTTRAYVEVEGWEIEDLQDDEGARWVTLSLANKGKAPATIITTAANFFLEKEQDVPPPPFDPEKGRLDTSMAGIKLFAADPLLKRGIRIPSGTALRKDIESRRVTLYVFFYIAYDDGISQRQDACSFVKYSLTSNGWGFVRVDETEYNWNT
jgi:hypothetical protein